MLAVRLVWLALVCLLVSIGSHAYRIGDPVDMLVRTQAGTSNAMRSQIPQFGMDRQVAFPQLRDQFSLIFSEGLWALPWTSVKDYRGKELQKVTVSFVFSKSGGGNDGTIHSVKSANVYREDGQPHKVLEIEYKWIEEEPIDIQAGSIVMFMFTLVAAIIFFIQSCGSVGDDGHGQQHGAEPSSVPKWD